MTEKITLSGVPETMLQIVYACARESEGRGTIHDPKAEKIIRRLDYDFSVADSDTAMRSGVIAHTLVLDRLARSWLAQHRAPSLSTSPAAWTPGAAGWTGTRTGMISTCRSTARSCSSPCPPWTTGAARSRSRALRCSSLSRA